MGDAPAQTGLMARLARSLREGSAGNAEATDAPQLRMIGMVTNDAVIRLAQSHWSSVSAESRGSTVRVTALI